MDTSIIHYRREYIPFAKIIVSISNSKILIRQLSDRTSRLIILTSWNICRTVEKKISYMAHQLTLTIYNPKFGNLAICGAGFWSKMLLGIGWSTQIMAELMTIVN